jgi:hypothetical protein
MGEILNEHVEWAVVNRFKAMLDEPPKTKFNVTQSFALFSAILLWTKQRAWVPERRLTGPADHAARAVRAALQAKSIVEPPWLLSQNPLEAATVNEPGVRRGRVNADFKDMTAEAFTKWVRDALAHGDGRTIKPIHKHSTRDDRSLLAGFEIRASARGDRERQLILYHADMKRIGAILADTFCQALSGGDKYFEQEAGTKVIERAA